MKKFSQLQKGGKEKVKEPTLTKREYLALKLTEAWCNQRGSANMDTCLYAFWKAFNDLSEFEEEEKNNGKTRKD